MYPGAIARAKKKLVAVSNDQDLQMSDDVRDAIESAMTAIYCLEKECERAYSDARLMALWRWRISFLGRVKESR